MAEGKLSTGIKGLDEILEGGIPQGFAVLVQGEPGTGKTTLGLQFVYHGAKEEGQPGMVVTFEQSPERMCRDAANLGWDIEGLLREGRIRIMATSPQAFVQQLKEPRSPFHKAIIEGGVMRLVIDSVSHFSRITHDPVQVREIIDMLINALRKYDLTTILTSEVHDVPGAVTLEEYAADALIRLYYEQVDELARRRFLEVVKVRGHPFIGGKHGMVIERGGIRVFPAPHPRGPRKAEEIGAEVRKVATGIEGLDIMLGGGLIEGFSTLIAGTPGTGRTAFGLHFLAEGAKNGEMGLLVSLEETPDKAFKCAKSIGIDLEGMVGEGKIVFIHRSPVILDPLELFDTIRRTVEERPIRRALIDPLTDIKTSIRDAAQFRDYLYALVDLFSSRGITSIFTAEVPPDTPETEVGDPNMAAIVDTIISLRFRRVEDQIRRTICLVKVRGSAHDTGVRWYKITDEGVQVAAAFIGVKEVPRVVLDL